MKKKVLAIAIVMSTFAVTACQPKAEQKPEPTTEQPASVVQDTTLKLQGETQKIPVSLPECSGNRCPEFSVDRLQTNQIVVDQQIDQAILQNLERILDIGKLKQDIQIEKNKQDVASEAVASASDVNTTLTPVQHMAIEIKPYVTAFLGLDQELKTLGASSQITLSISPKILNSEGALATVVLNTSSYMGGAHGSSSQIYYNFDLKTQKLVPLDHIVASGQKAQLEKLAYEAFKKWVAESELSTNITEYEQVWKFKLSDNYYLGENSLILQYGEYEIGPYVVGLPRLEIPYSQLNKILKKEYLPINEKVDQQIATSATIASKDNKS